MGNELMSDAMRALVKERDRAANRLFGLLLEAIPIIAAPAGIAAFIMLRYHHKEWGFFLLPLTFVLSMTILFWRYKSIAKRIESVSDKIHELKKIEQQ